MNPRLQVMIDSREIEAADAPGEEVAARWRRAVDTYVDAGKDLGASSRLTLYYQAALQASTALIRASGFRVLGSDHHRHTFEALHALGLGELSMLGRAMNAFRRSRHQAVYDWQEAPGNPADEAATLRELAENVRRMLVLGHAWLAANRLDGPGGFDPPPDS